MKYIIFNKVNGEIARQVECDPSLIEENLETGEDYIESPQGYLDPIESFYFVDPPTKSLVAKRTLALQVEVNGLSCTVSNIPVGAMVLCDFNEPTEVNDGVLEVDFEAPGAYQISVVPGLKYIAEDLEVTIG